MNQYTIYCTPDQTRKALELGAPLYKLSMSVDDSHLRDKSIRVGDQDELIDYAIPTADQMIGWLEEKLGFASFDIVRYSRCGYGFSISLMYEDCIIEHLQSEECLLHRSRKEAILDAIDAALEYLVNSDLIK